MTPKDSALLRDAERACERHRLSCARVVGLVKPKDNHPRTAGDVLETHMAAEDRDLLAISGAVKAWNAHIALEHAADEAMSTAEAALARVREVRKDARRQKGGGRHG